MRQSMPANAIDARGYADRTARPLRPVKRDEEKGDAWRIKFRNGKGYDLWRRSPKPGQQHPAVTQRARTNRRATRLQLLFNELKYIRHDDGDIHTPESNGLKMKEGCTTNETKPVVEDNIDVLHAALALVVQARLEARYWGQDKKIVIAGRPTSTARRRGMAAFTPSTTWAPDSARIIPKIMRDTHASI